MHDQSSLWPAHGAEEWRPVPGYEGRYEVSDAGRVRSLRDRNHGSDRLRPEPLVLRPSANKWGYRVVKLGSAWYRVHRLVLEAFVGQCPLGYQGAHLNGVRDDNRLVNLAWKTPQENAEDRDRHGTTPRGERHGSHTHPERWMRHDRHPQAKLTVEQVIEIRAASARGETYVALGARYGVDRTTVGGIVRGTGWRHVGD